MSRLDPSSRPLAVRRATRRDSFGGHVSLPTRAPVTIRVITASAPARIDFAGGWTDVAPYTTEVGGAVCNVAIELRAVATVRAAELPVAPDDPLLRAAWQRSGMPAVSIGLTSDIPVGSGLGGSSAAGVALAAALAAWQGQRLSRQELAELSRSTETETMGLAGGCQDHYAAAYGGALLLTCRAETVASPVWLTHVAVDELELRVLIAYTGESRMSSNTITSVMNSYRDKEAITSASLRTMADLAPLMAELLTMGDIDHLGALVAAQWAAQRALHPSITTPLIDRIVADAEMAGALGTKALGASGGGCVLVVAARDRVAAVREAVAGHATMLPFRVARTGVQIHDTGDLH